MYELFTTENTLIIQEEKEFCRTPKFNSDFPQELIGIIHPYEFQQSIDNINRARKAPLGVRILRYSLLLCLLIGLIIFIVGVSLVGLSNKTVWIVLMSTGGGIFVGVKIFILVCLWFMPPNYRRFTDAVNAESMKYSTRIPIPTRWRLSVSVISRAPINGNWRNRVIYSLIIDIGKKVNPKIRGDALKSNSLEPTSYIGRPYPAFPSSQPNVSATNASDRNL